MIMREEQRMSSEQELHELRDPKAWDSEHGETRGPVKNPRAIVSVAFSTPEFREITSYARRNGMRTSEFIRTAAIERARRPQSFVVYDVGIASAGTTYQPGASAQTIALSTLRQADNALATIGG
jgi:hypothetical protein